ncbi:MAG: prepilin-type N-terminal cleavage/methylation domain-containing protein [Desulfobacteraceae bacterium]|nr:prepilin-type N-terminal cleavage/methylation domain-containing protein [Desulfobacteraceae bacterium]
MMTMSGLKAETGNWKLETGNWKLETRNQKPKTGRYFSKFQVSSFKFQLSTFNFQPGFTLLEVMVAVSILAIALVSIYRLHTQTISMNNAIKFHTVAPLLAQGKLAEFEIKPADELEDDSGDFGDDFPGYNWRASVEDVEPKELEELEGYAILKKIDVTVNFEGGGFVYHFGIYRLVLEE